jgi:regulator of sigma E protease
MFNVVFAFLMFIPAFMGRDGGSMIQAMQSSAHTVWIVVAGTFSMIGHFLAGQSGMASISGPVGIAVMAGQAASGGLVDLLFFTGVLSLSLGIMNLMPFPGLDGGQLMILLIETVLDRPLATRAHQIINVAGIMLITGLSIVVTWHDIVRLAS